MRALGIAIFALALAALPAHAGGTYDPGASDTEIKLGNTFPYSGPSSPTATIPREMAGYFTKLNEEGGVNGRKIDFISLDDGYLPPKTVELTRRLVEQDQVLAIFGSEGTPTQLAVRAYLNGRKIPQLFPFTGSNTLIDPKKYPYTVALGSSYGLEGAVWAKYILAERPNAKIGIFYQNDDFGGDHMGPFLATLGDKAKTMVVGKESYLSTDTTVTSQIISLRGAGADTFVLFATARQAAQAVSAARDQGGPDAMIFVPYAASARSILAPVGDEKLKGILSDRYVGRSDRSGLGRQSRGQGLSRLRQEIYAGDGPGERRRLAGRLSRRAGHGRGAAAMRRHAHARQRHECRDAHEGLDLPAVPAGHEPHDHARRLFPDARDADETL